MKKVTPQKKVRITLDHLHEHILKIGIDINTLKKQNLKIMASLQEALDKANELSTKVDELQATIDAEQADIAALQANNAQVVSDLNAQIAALQAIIDANPGVDAQPVIDSLTATIDKINAASADVSSTV